MCVNFFIFHERSAHTYCLKLTNFLKIYSVKSEKQQKYILDQSDRIYFLTLAYEITIKLHWTTKKN